MSSGEPQISPYEEQADRPALHACFAAAVEEGVGFPTAPPATDDDLERAFLANATVLVARIGERFAGAYYVRANYPGRAAHIANAGYLVEPHLRRRGIGRALVLHSLETARGLGFDAMIFNLVFEDNPARALYEELGFQAVGRVPRAVEGTDAIIYWREL